MSQPQTRNNLSNVSPQSFAPSLAVSNQGVMMKLLFFSSFWRLIAAQANTWEALSPTGSIPSARDLHTAMWSDTADGFYVFGGYDGNYVNDLYLYRREANTWEALSPTGSIPSVRRSTAVRSDTADGFYVFGGYGGNYFNDLYLYRSEVGSGT
eukprot:symbB.v1.2.022994.t2/scaffold2041.1/size91352/4